MSSSDNFNYIIRPVKVRSEFIAWRISSRLVTFIAFELDKGYEDDWSDDSPYGHYANVEPIVNDDGTRTRYEVRTVIPTDVEYPSISDIGVQLVCYKIDKSGKQSDAYVSTCNEARKSAPKLLRKIMTLDKMNQTDQRIRYAPLDGVEIHRGASLQSYRYGKTKQDFDTELFFHFLSAVTGKNCMRDIIKCFHDFDVDDNAKNVNDVSSDIRGNGNDDIPNKSDNGDDVSQSTDDADISKKLDKLVSLQQEANELLREICGILAGHLHTR